MAISMREKVMDQVKSLPESQLTIAFQMLSQLPSPLPPAARPSDVLQHVGTWSDEDGAEIAAIIERDCERVPIE